jgi:RNA polymerase sigma-70 factor, ECF subfamily
MPEPLVPADVVRVCLEAPSESAWEDFVRCFQQDIAATISYVVRSYRHSDLSLIDDLVQETYLRLCRNNAYLLRTVCSWESGAIRAYLKRTAESVARDHFRSATAQKRGGGQGEEMLDLEPIAGNASAEDLVLLAEIDRFLDQKVDRPRDRAIYRLVRVQGFNPREVSELPHVDLSAKGVESCLFRIDSLLRKALGCKRVEGIARPITLGGLDEEA